MKGLLIRVGIDSMFGGWNAPVDPKTYRFLYVPIPEDTGIEFRNDFKRKYNELIPEINTFYRNYDCEFDFPNELEDRSIHLDPDFQNLTYGDQGKRANPIRKMGKGDLIVFYAGLRSIRKTDKDLVYAIIGLYIVDEIVDATKVPKDRWFENAHTRRDKSNCDDIVVRADKNFSGRLERCIPIGEWRENAYRVKKDILKEWGGITVKNGYIQRSATLPYFKKPEIFYNWFKKQNIQLIKRNNNSE